MKTIQEHLYWGKEHLDEHQIQDANLSTKVLLSFATGIPSIDFIKNPETEVSPEMSKQFKDLIQKRAEDYPVAYLTGEKEFYSLKFFVNESVLIPRPETEMLIDWFGEKIGNQNVSVCDVGTGSGAIAITLKKVFPKLNITALEISPQALAVARMNAKNHQVEIDFIESDLFKGVSKTFDIVVANLPYVSAREMMSLPPSVRDEPVLALESGVDGLEHCRRLLQTVGGSLQSKGSIFLEFGQGQKDGLISLLQKDFFSSIEVRQDLSGIDRVVYAQRK